MVVVEGRRNIPTAVGPANIPTEKRWGLLRNIADLPSVIAGTMDRSFLPQLLERRPLLTLLEKRPRLLRQPSYETTWPITREIGRLPSVISILSGPPRTLHPEFKQELVVEW